MIDGIRVLIAGESWVTHSIHQKGVDSFTTSTYEEGVQWLRAALESGGIIVDFLPNHLASAHFPSTPEGLAPYGAVVLSDIGTNTLLLSPETLQRSMRTANRLSLLRDYVAAGGGLVMVGGYMTFQGIDGRARYSGTPIEEALPVRLFAGDDRVEAPEGIHPIVRSPDHPIAGQLPAEWPYLLGYNRVSPKSEAAVIATLGDDPLIAAWEFDQGRAVAFTSDCGPHWCPPDFISWSGYVPLWQHIICWVARSEDSTGR